MKLLKSDKELADPGHFSKDLHRKAPLQALPAYHRITCRPIFFKLLHYLINETSFRTAELLQIQRKKISFVLW